MKTGGHLALVAMVVATVLAASPARGEFSLATGLKWSPLRYTQPLSVTSNAGMPVQNTLYGWQTTSLDSSFAAFPTERLGIVLGLDFGYGSQHSDLSGGGATMNTDQSFTQLGFSVGGKYYFLPPKAGRAVPYALVDFYKYFAFVSTSDAMIKNDQAAAAAGMHSPIGFDAALGAEYFVSSAFSIGAEVLGARFAYVEGDYAGGFNTKVTQSAKYFTLYTALSLNYRFGSSGAARGESEAPAAKPHPRRPEAPPAGEPPPAAPESVD